MKSIVLRMQVHFGIPARPSKEGYVMDHSKTELSLDRNPKPVKPQTEPVIGKPNWRPKSSGIGNGCSLVKKVLECASSPQNSSGENL